MRRDVAMVMDADSVIVPEFLETAMGRLEADPDLIAVGGVFYGEDGWGLVGQLQRNEYTRYQRHISRRRGKVFVLTGTASLFRTYALKAVADSRGQLLPGDPGQVYDTLALTEDNEMTLSLKSLGAKMVSPMQCRVVTEVMPTWRALWRQRMRWQRGALENIGAYGLTRATLRYWLQQIAIGYGTIALNAYLLLMLITLLAADSFQFVWFWVAIGSIFVVERVVTVWAVGWRGRAIALPLVIETRLRPRPAGRLRQVPLRHRYRPRRRLELRPPRAAAARAVAPVTILAGILLPSDVLHSGWFQALADLRRDQHPHLRRAEPREPHPAAARVGAERTGRSREQLCWHGAFPKRAIRRQQVSLSANSRELARQIDRERAGAEGTRLREQCGGWGWRATMLAWCDRTRGAVVPCRRCGHDMSGRSSRRC